jgi:hypothetical protein
VAEGRFREKRLALARVLLHPGITKMTVGETGALTVAGQWRTFTAFPNILAIAVVSRAAASNRCSDVMEWTSMT